jgi:hypothetical protein
MLYNEHLKESKRAKNQPYMLRKNFDKISTTVELSLKKLSAFFEKHKEINPSEFFRAPYKIYSTEEYFDIKFYTTQKAITVYKIFKQSIDTNKKPDIFLSRDETDSKDLSVEEKTKQNK